MVHTRETRASASEVKFVIDPAAAPRIAEWARQHLRADPHGQGPHHDEYETSSLYFDTRLFDVLRRRGSYGRAKYRIRRYGDASTVFLERKLRKPGVLVKRRTLAGIDTLERLGGTGTEAWAGSWFQERLRVRRLHPVCRLSYHRMARAVPCDGGVARLTLDRDLRVSPATIASFEGGAGTPFLEDAMILELKHPGALPAVFRRLVEEFALEPGTASKYRLGMTALGHSPLAAGAAEPLADGTASYA